MAIKLISLLSTKISPVLSSNTQLSSIQNSLSTIINPISSIISSITNKPTTIDLSSLSSSLPKLMSLMTSLSASTAKPTLNTDTINTLMQTLQPLLQSANGTSSINQSQLLQSLPTVVNSITTLINSFGNQGNVSDSVSSAITAVKPLLTILAGASSNTDVSQIVSTLSKIIDIAQPIIQVAGSATSGNVDFGDIAKGATQALMPLLASIDTGNSKIDMALLQKALPSVIGSVTTLVGTLTKANEGNIPETISGVIKGISPLLKLLADSGSLDTDQVTTVNTVYNLLNSVKAIIDFTSNPSLLTLSSDLNNIIDSLKPVIAVLDQKGDFSNLLDNVHIPDLGDLLGSLSKPSTDQSHDSNSSTTTSLPNLSDLLSNASGLGQIDLSTIAPQLGEAANKIAGLLTGNIPELITTLPLTAPVLDLNTPTSYV
ncbi:hypothetical protein D9K79_15215 [Acinetobacter cumulans]|uniref:Uncharacterized protein n=1 Tax=Acinetobacter cumulans TaxID=2136182 RepID=A0ABX9U3F7_9GAMM|nr:MULTISPECIES: hypothetical protein [Acinetobacter]NWK76113.1 hypothetical protein [Acinetobacter sp. SwsAc6]QCO22525.1 hypothetical protein C9E88_014000 [Acinetobacter cumulans]RLL39556.1 hypothetical protein D9K79_15215 [Acinetobacter cumulans]